MSIGDGNYQCLLIDADIISQANMQKTMDPAEKYQSILLADDDEDDIFLFQEALSEMAFPYELTIARDGIEALECIKESPLPDLVILDINMPRKNGFEFLEEIQCLPNAGDIPVVCLSTSKSPDFISRARLLGAKGYFAKPVSFKGYQSMVADVLSKDWKKTRKVDFYCDR